MFRLSVLFNIFRNDLDEGVDEILIKSVDEMLIKSVDDTEDRNKIQDDLNRLENWTKTNKMYVFIYLLLSKYYIATSN